VCSSLYANYLEKAESKPRTTNVRDFIDKQNTKS